MEVMLTLTILVWLAVLFLVVQHGLANTLKSIGIAFLRAGKRREARTADRGREVNEQMVRELEA